MQPWTDELVWAAVDAWRWKPPSSQTVRLHDYELVVTPGSSALNFAYGFRVEPESRTDQVLRDLRARVESMGGTGVRISVTPLTRPAGLPERLTALGYVPRDEAEVLVWELRDESGRRRLPDFRAPTGVGVREATTDLDYRNYQSLTSTIFGEPEPSPETSRAFLEEFHQRIQDGGHSDRFLAWEAEVPVGVAGLEVAGPVARFFGTGVISSHRRRGIYGSLVRSRCEAAAERAAEIAITTARIATSGPILKHHGFRRVGPFAAFDLRW